MALESDWIRGWHATPRNAILALEVLSNNGRKYELIKKSSPEPRVVARTELNELGQKYTWQFPNLIITASVVRCVVREIGSSITHVVDFYGSSDCTCARCDTNLDRIVAVICERLYHGTKHSELYKSPVILGRYAPATPWLGQTLSEVFEQAQLYYFGEG